MQHHQFLQQHELATNKNTLIAIKKRKGSINHLLFCHLHLMTSWGSVPADDNRHDNLMACF